MGPEHGHTTQIERCLERLGAGDADASAELLQWSDARLRRLARKLLRAYPSVARWEQTDDVLQNAALRLNRALRTVHPESVAGFIGLAARQIRRELIDMARHYMGPEGMGAHHCTGNVPVEGGKSQSEGRQPAAHTDGPATLAEWTDFHRLAANLPPAERETFDLHYYGGLSQQEGADAIGISLATFKRRWQSARLLLHRALHGERLGI